MTASGTGPSFQRLGRYHLGICLGGGPTGEVYRAKVYGVAGMDREFAVKRFHASYVAEPGKAHLIAAAARSYGALEHPRVAKLQEFGVTGGQTFTATEFVDGLDLSQLLDHGQLPLGSAAQLVVQVARAVGYAHGRGLSHLGLSPTNVICTDSGEVKVTDFGFLPSRLPDKPLDDPSLGARICYLAPEQIDGQSTSPATDVYQLGTIAYELMVGRKPFPGRTAGEIAQKMLSLPVPDSGLAKPYEKLLKRALARSPFERFPDTGAMADALEAALRSTPVPGSAFDAGKAVAARRASLLEHRESQASGVLSFPMPAPPQAAREEVLAAVSTPPPTPGREAPGPTPIARTNLAQIPSIVPKAPALPPLPETDSSGEPTDPDFVSGTANQRPETFSDMETIPSHELRPERESAPGADILLGPAGTDAEAKRGQFIGGESTDENLPTLIRAESSDGLGLHERARGGTDDDEETIVRPETGGPRQAPLEAPPVDNRPTIRELPAESVSETGTRRPGSNLDGIDEEVSALLKVPVGAPESVELPPFSTASPAGLSPLQGNPREVPPAAHGLGPQAKARPKRNGMRALLYLVLFGTLGVGSFFGYSLLTGDGQEETAKVAETVDAGAQRAPGDARQSALLGAQDSGAGGSDASGDTIVASSGADAATSALALPGPMDAGATIQSAPSDQLQIDSEPSGAKVYLDGTLVGNTPLGLDGSPDSHHMALILAGHDLYSGDIKGTGSFKIALREVTPPDGPAGIKVRCKKKNRYYVYVDGNPVGQLCPSERIGVSKGKHVVEIYDPVTDSRRAFDVQVNDTRLSLRVKVD